MIVLHDLEPSVESFGEAVLHGLAQPQKRVPCKYFYDEAGSALFNDICELDEYYPTRTELKLLQAHGGDVAALIGPDSQLVELGSGASRKVRLLLDRLERPAGYVAVDISRQQLIAAAEAIAGDYPNLAVNAICADYTQPFEVPERTAGRRLAFFPGSTIGNFAPAQAQRFLAGCRRMLGAAGAMLVGVDLKKDPAILHAAYNDARGVTAAFNLNLLRRINTELEGDFDLNGFAHRARYDAAAGRIEMHLVSRRPQRARVLGRVFEFAAGEAIHTEDSYKYSLDDFAALASAAGFEPVRAWTDPQALFSLHFLALA